MFPLLRSSSKVGHQENSQLVTVMVNKKCIVILATASLEEWPCPFLTLLERGTGLGWTEGIRVTGPSPFWVVLWERLSLLEKNLKSCYGPFTTGGIFSQNPAPPWLHCPTTPERRRGHGHFKNNFIAVSLGSALMVSHFVLPRWFSRCVVQSRGQELVDGIKACLQSKGRKGKELCSCGARSKNWQFSFLKTLLPCCPEGRCYLHLDDTR